MPLRECEQRAGKVRRRCGGTVLESEECPVGCKLVCTGQGSKGMDLHKSALVLRKKQVKDAEDMDQDLVDAAAQVFMDEIQTMARAIAVKCGMSKQTRQDFVGASVGVAYQALRRFDPRRGQAGSFFYTVLLNHAYDLLKRKIRPLECVVPDDQLQTLPGDGALERYAQDGSTFVQKALEFLRTLGVRDRVVLCLGLRIEDLIPPSEWEQWWNELGLSWKRVRLAIVTANGRVDRSALAEVLGMQRGALDKVVSRRRGGLERSLSLGLGLGGSCGSHATPVP